MDENVSYKFTGGIKVWVAKSAVIHSSVFVPAKEGLLVKKSNKTCPFFMYKARQLYWVLPIIPLSLLPPLRFAAPLSLFFLFSGSWRMELQILIPE